MKASSSKVEVDVDVAEKLNVGRSDFLHALENDIKPAFGAADEKLEGFLSRGMINRSDPVQLHFFLLFYVQYY